ncbi:MAG: carbon-nitrogen hydrolase [Nitrospinae bacterium]|nr:carbon-nitrogen hydrolase [Nitrospinota bacterium]
MSMSTDPAENMLKAVSLIESAANAGASVICLPELFLTPYFCQREDAALFNHAEPIPGPATDTLCKAAARTGAVIVASLFEKRAKGLYHNTTAVIGPDGKLMGIYRKNHIPDDPSYYEKYYFTPGDLGFKTFDTSFGKLGVLICWDQWYPEAARLTALLGAEVIFYPTAIGWHPAEREQFGAAQKDAWRTVQRGHAIANGVYVAAVNRVGREITKEGGDGIQFWGGSFISDPFGVVTAEASADREEILITEVDPAKIEETRRNWPFLRDRRIDLYGGITSRYSD